jgi:hypothetical protein
MAEVSQQRRFHPVPLSKDARVYEVDSAGRLVQPVELQFTWALLLQLAESAENVAFSALLQQAITAVESALQPYQQWEDEWLRSEVDVAVAKRCALCNTNLALLISKVALTLEALAARIDPS